MTAKEAFQNLFLDVWRRDEEINKKQLIVLNALNELDELKRDVARYFELEGNYQKSSHAYHEMEYIKNKLMKVGK